MRNVGLDEAQVGIKIVGRNINNLRCRLYHTYGQRQRTKEPLDDSERREWKSWLKTQHSETKIIASGPITSWQIDGETVEIVTDCLFIYFFGPQITADGDYSHEIERYLSLKEKLSPT